MNRIENVFRPLSWLIAVLLAAVVAGCGGGGGGDAAPAAAPVAAAAPVGDVSGVWTITESEITSPATQCIPPSNPLASYPLTVAQLTPATHDLSATDATNPDTPATFPGTINGTALSWSGNFAERGGTTTWNSVSVTVAPDCNSLSGTATWTYVQDPATATFSCTAVTTFTGTKNSASGCGLESAS